MGRPLDDCGSISTQPGTLGKVTCSLLRAVPQASLALSSVNPWPSYTLRTRAAVATSLMLSLAPFYPVQPFWFISFWVLLLINSSSPPPSSPPSLPLLSSPLLSSLVFWGPNSGFKACTSPTTLAPQPGKYFLTFLAVLFSIREEGRGEREKERQWKEGGMEEVRCSSVYCQSCCYGNRPLTG